MKIVLDHITKRYPSRTAKGEEVIAVNDFDLTIPDGKLFGLLGPSGCGKSTTLNMICGLEAPSEGRIFFGEDDVTDLPPEVRGVGMVFQSYALYPHMTVRENIMFPLENLKRDERPSKEEMLARVEETAALVQIENLLDRKPSEMSGGQQQRVAIARALVKAPKVLLLDEPLSNLDARLRLSTREEIRRIQRETGVTTIFVTHDQEEAMSISDEIVVMESGFLRQQGRPQDVYDEPNSLFVAKFLGTPPINIFAGTVRNEQLYIGDTGADEAAGTDADVAPVMKVAQVPDGPVTVGIRPEGFVPEEGAPLECELLAVERMGRDTSVVARHEAHDGTEIRTIVSSDAHVDTSKSTVNFRIRPSKTRLFNPETGERIHFLHDEETEGTKANA